MCNMSKTCADCRWIFGVADDLFCYEPLVGNEVSPGDACEEWEPSPNDTPDLDKCPVCGGPADNGHDRCFPPNPYYCTKCQASVCATNLEKEIENV